MKPILRRVRVIPKRSSWDIDESDYDNRNRIKTLRRLLNDMHSHRHEFYMVIISIVINAAAGALYPISLAFAINGVVYRHILDLYIFGTVFFLLYLVQFFASRSRTIFSTYLAQSVVKNMRDKSFENLQYVPAGFFSRVKAGYLISRITNDGEMLSEFLTFQLPQVLSGITTVIVSVGVMFYYDINLAMYALVIVPIVIAFSFAIRNRVRNNYIRTRKTIAAITGNIAENIGAIRAIKSFDVEDNVDANFDSLNNQNFKANMVAARLSSSYGAVLRVIEAFGIVLVIYVGAGEVFSGVITLGILVAFIVYVQEFFDPVTQLSQLYNSYQSAMVGAERIYGIMDYPHETESGEGGLPITSIKKVEFKNVTFSYGDKPALKNITLEINSGDHLGIVGHTGAGKTTLSSLILKFYSPTDGTILLNGEDIRSIDTRNYRKFVVPVLQDIMLFKGSIFENIIFYEKGKTREDVEALIKEFNLEEIFKDLSDGIDTDVGEMGRNLSEGQRQSISILRAFIRNPEVILLDEPTSQIDLISEKLLIRSLKKFLENRTLILITHRFSMISLVDRIVVLQYGEIVEQGTYIDLINSKGFFYKMNLAQSNLET